MQWFLYFRKFYKNKYDGSKYGTSQKLYKFYIWKTLTDKKKPFSDINQKKVGTASLIKREKK